MSERWLLLLAVLPLIVIWATAFLEVVTRDDLRPAGRLGWFAVLLLAPVVGLAVYVVARPTRPRMASERATASTSAEALVVVAERRHRGEIGDGEYRRAARELL